MQPWISSLLTLPRLLSLLTFNGSHIPEHWLDSCLHTCWLLTMPRLLFHHIADSCFLILPGSSFLTLPRPQFPHTVKTPVSSHCQDSCFLTLPRLLFPHTANTPVSSHCQDPSFLTLPILIFPHITKTPVSLHYQYSCFLTLPRPQFPHTVKTPVSSHYQDPSFLTLPILLFPHTANTPVSSHCQYSCFLTPPRLLTLSHCQESKAHKSLYWCWLFESPAMYFMWSWWCLIMLCLVVWKQCATLHWQETPLVSNLYMFATNTCKHIHPMSHNHHKGHLSTKVTLFST